MPRNAHCAKEFYRQNMILSRAKATVGSLEYRGCEEANVGGKAYVAAWMRKWYTTVTS